MSSASNLGYGNVSPLSNVNANYVNVDNSNYAGRFSSNEIPHFGLVGAKSNVDAAAGIIGGGTKSLKRKIKNITKHYKRMKRGSRHARSIKRRIRKRAISRKRSATFAGGRRHTRRRHRGMRGGYSQYQNNMPSTGVYSTAGVHLSASDSALANPPPITQLSNCVNCVDSYNHYTNSGFPSKGH